MEILEFRNIKTRGVEVERREILGNFGKYIWTAISRTFAINTVKKFLFNIILCSTLYIYIYIYYSISNYKIIKKNKLFHYKESLIRIKSGNCYVHFAISYKLTINTMPYKMDKERTRYRERERERDGERER